MGSYLTIVNDTPLDWECHVGTDTQSLDLIKTIATTLGAIASITQIIGFGAPFGIPLSDTAEFAHDLGDVGDMVDSTSAKASFGVRVAKKLSKYLVDEGFYPIPSNNSRRWGKMTLSLWQQGTCVHTEIINATHVTVHKLSMRPIFSGASINSNKNYSMQFWIEKNCTQTFILEQTPTPKSITTVQPPQELIGTVF